MFLYGAVAGFEPTYGHLITPWHAFEHAFIASFGSYVITAAVTLHPHPYPRGHCNVMSIGCEYEYENGSVDLNESCSHTHTLWENKDTEFHTNRLWMWIGFVLMYHQMLRDICDITNISQCICVHGWGSRDVEKDMCAIQKDNTPHIFMCITNRHINLIRVYLQKYNRMFPRKMTSY